MKEPWPPAKVKRLVLAALMGGYIEFSEHAWNAMEDDDLEAQDVYEVLREGNVGPGDKRKGTWRYTFKVKWAGAVVTFRSGRESVVVVTAWGKP